MPDGSSIVGSERKLGQKDGLRRSFFQRWVKKTARNQVLSKDGSKSRDLPGRQGKIARPPPVTPRFIQKPVADDRFTRRPAGKRIRSVGTVEFSVLQDGGACDFPKRRGFFFQGEANECHGMEGSTVMSKMPKVERTKFSAIIERTEKQKANRTTHRVFLTDRVKNENNHATKKR
jgi:hypothetical protein